MRAISDYMVHVRFRRSVRGGVRSWNDGGAWLALLFGVALPGLGLCVWAGGWALALEAVAVLAVGLVSSSLRLRGVKGR